MGWSGPVGLISNPNSGHNRDQFEKIRSRIDGISNIHHIITQSAAEIGPALESLAAHNIEVLAINGGDGTAAAVLGELLESTLFEQLPHIILLPAGTANMTAGDIGVSGSLAKAVERFCLWCERQPPNKSGSTQTLQQRAMLKVTTDGEQQRRYGMFLGGGAIIHGTEYAHENLHSRGMRDDFSVAFGTVRTVWGVLRNDPAFNRHVAINTTLDDREPTQSDTLILAISTLQRLAFGMRPFWSDEAGAIRVTLMEQGCTRFARTFFSIVRGRPSRNAVPSSGYHSHNADRITLQLQGKLNLDGEILDINDSIIIEASKPLEFLQL
jgi:diacylglycerol kinase (ATP)